MNGTPRGRTSRLKQRRTESRQEQNFPHFFDLFPHWMSIVRVMAGFFPGWSVAEIKCTVHICLPKQFQLF